MIRKSSQNVSSHRQCSLHSLTLQKQLWTGIWNVIYDGVVSLPLIEDNSSLPHEPMLSKCKHRRNEPIRSQVLSAHAQYVPACRGVCRWSVATLLSVCWVLCSVNRPVEGLLIDSFSPLSVSLSAVPRVACISPGSPCSLPRPSSLPAVWLSGDRWRGESQTWAGITDGRRRRRRLLKLLLHLSELLMVLHINPVLSSPPCVHSIRSVMQKYLEERDELTFDKIFNQKIGKSQCFYYMKG